MLHIDRANCTGCAACEQTCPVYAIEMKKDQYGFVFPTIDESKCISCDKCVRVCHLNSEIIKNKPNAEYAMQLSSNEDLMKVSSGGAFLALARSVLADGGIVYGATQISIDNVEHIRVTEEKQLDLICRSKYLQSNIRNCFKQIEEDLKTHIVMFCGTGCQTNSLLSYLGGKREGLLLCDIVCHGVPSPLAFNKYCEEIENKHNSTIKSFVYRDKSAGWNKNQYCITFENGDCIKERSNVNAFHGTYLQGLMYRKSCENCRYAQIERISDVVIADFWKYDGKLRENNKGVSLVLSYTKMGEEYIEKSKKYAIYEQVRIEQAIESCRHLSQAPKINKNRTRFLETMEKHTYFKAYRKYAFPKNVASKIKLLLKNRGK